MSKDPYQLMSVLLNLQLIPALIPEQELKDFHMDLVNIASDEIKRNKSVMDRGGKE